MARCGCSGGGRDVRVVEEDAAVFPCYFETLETKAMAVNVGCNVFDLLEAVVLPECCQGRTNTKGKG